MRKLIASLFLVAGLALAQSVGTLEVVVSGLPNGADSQISVSGGKLTRPVVVTRSSRISNLVPGAYTVTALAVASGGATYQPTPLRQTVQVQAQQTARAAVNYQIPPGRVRINIEGLPSTSTAQVTLRGNQISITVGQSSRIADIPPGSYVLSAQSVAVNGVNYQPVPPTQTLQVRSDEESSASITYKPPAGSLRLGVEGLPIGSNAKVVVRGPESFRREITLNELSGATLSNLTPGAYTITSSELVIAGDPYEPKPLVQSVNVQPARTTQAKISFVTSPAKLTLSTRGLPDGLAATVTLTGPEEPQVITLAAPRTLSLTRGSYAISTGLLYYQGQAFGPTQSSQTIELKARQEGQLVIAYRELASGSLTLNPVGLPVDTSVNVALSGPDGFRLELTLAGSETLLNLLPGEYRLQPAVAAGPGYGIQSQTFLLAPGANSRLNLETSPGMPDSAELSGTLEGHNADVTAVAFAPNSRTLASVGFDRNVRLWDVQTRQNLATLAGHAELISSLVFSPDGRVLATASYDNTVKLWDVQTRQELATLRGHTSPISAVAFSPDGRIMASASYDNTVRLWDVQTRQELATLRGHTSTVLAVVFSPDGRSLVSASMDSTVRLWDIQTRQELAALRGHSGAVRSLAFSSDGRTVASGGDDNTVKLWDAQIRQNVATLQGHTDDVGSVAFAPGGYTLVSASKDDTLKLWDVQTRRELATLRGHRDDATSVSFSPDGRLLASGSADSTIKLWRLVYTFDTKR